MFRIREANCDDAPAIARVHVDSWRTAYRGIVPDDVLAKLSYEERTSTWTWGLSHLELREFHYVAEDEAEGVIGFVSGGPERSGDPVYTGELYRIWLLERHQRRGIGRQLVHATVQRLAEACFRSMLVWVLAGNPSRGFYEALGGQFVRNGQTEIEGAFFDQVAYGWRDTGTIGGM